ncbi:MAG: helix-turn-helix domain-containing protein, partial [Rhodanobacter sp.]
HDAWRESIGPLFDVSPVASNPQESFNATLQSYLWNRQLVLGRTECSAMRFERSPLRLARDGLDYYLIQTHLAGSQDLRRGNRQVHANTGDLMVIDLAERHAAVTSDFCNLTLIIPRHLLAPHLLQPDSQQGRILRKDNALAELAVRHLIALYGVAERVSPAEALRLIEPTLMLLASALNGGTESVEKGVNGVAHSLVTRARMEIDNRLHQNLTVDDLCRALRISRTVLYRLFEPLGGVRAYIQECRLRRCAQALLAPRYARRKILDIAFAHGFQSEAHFSRAFKHKYGLNPSEARKDLLAPTALVAASTEIEELGEHYHEQWVRETLRC